MNYLLMIGDDVVATSNQPWVYVPERKTWDANGMCYVDNESLAKQFSQNLQISPPQFKLQFTAAERIKIRMARAYTGEDTTKWQVKYVLDDWFDILDDTRLTMVDLSLGQTRQGVEFLVTVGIMEEARVEQVLMGLLTPVE